MNKDLENAIKNYSKGSSTFVAELNRHSKPNIVAMFTDLLTLYINDLNSSTLREMLTLAMAGYDGYPDRKIGYNGYKMDGRSNKIECEVKPKNFRKESTAKAPQKLNGSGNFTDYTWKRFRKNKRENPNMLVSGFVDGKLIYIFEFPFTLPSFTKRLEAKLKKRFPDRKDRPNEFLRSADFYYANFIDGAELIYLADDYADYEKCMVAPFYKKLRGKNHINREQKNGE